MIRLTAAGDAAALADAPPRPAQVASVQTTETPGGLRMLTTGDPDTALAAVVEEAVAYHLTGVTVEPVSLQAVFLDLTGRSLRD